MTTDFRIVALEAAEFAALFALGEQDLHARGIRSVVADEDTGFPCRVSLADAAVGDRLLLLPYVHHDVDGPYRASGPIFVREGAVTARPAVNQIPPMLVRRLLSLRAYDAAGMLLAAEVTPGESLAEQIRRLFADPRATALHVHNARPGCFNCRVVRA